MMESNRGKSKEGAEKPYCTSGLTRPERKKREPEESACHVG